MIDPKLVLWVYIVLLVVGGLIGFFKARSVVSLVVAAGFAGVLTLCQIGVISGPPHLVDWLLVTLLIVFAVRAADTKKFMPGGLMLVLTVVALALMHFRR